jgi:hypothetical protein
MFSKTLRLSFGLTMFFAVVYALHLKPEPKHLVVEEDDKSFKKLFDF